MSSGVDRLRTERGSEEVTFDDVADHLEDFVRREPDAGRTIERLAVFLAKLEQVDHDHERDGGSSITS
jgi:hypothetical protein